MNIGLCTSQNTIHAKIILAGDPKQLDAITRSKMAQRLGYKRSWLDTLCAHELYKDKAGKYNESYISMLVKNYRSHPSILNLSNKLFYKGQLEALASKSKNSIQTLYFHLQCRFYTIDKGENLINCLIFANCSYN